MALTQIKTTGIADDAVTEAKVANDAIGTAEMKAGTDGHIITYDASGNPTTVGPGTDGQVLTSTGAGSPPAFEDASSTTINNNADNRVITGSGTAGTLEGEANLTFSSNTLTVHEASLKGNQLLFNTSGTTYIDHSTTGQDIQFRTSVSSSQDTTGPTIKSDGKVGIGEATPLAQLHIKPASNMSQLLLEQNNATDGYALFQDGPNGGHLKFRRHINGTETQKLLLRSDGGLCFGTDSAAANALDDYEEGTFTPNWDAAGGVTFSYFHQYGFYTKIGDTVTFQIYLMGYASTITGGNDGNGVVIQGLPYTILNHARYYPAFTIGRTYKVQLDDDKRLYAYGDSNSTNIRLIQEDNDTVGSLLTAVQLDQNPCQMLVGGVYRV